MAVDQLTLFKDATIDDLSLSVRTWRILKNVGISSLKELEDTDPLKLAWAPLMGRKSLNEIRDGLYRVGHPYFHVLDDYLQNRPQQQLPPLSTTERRIAWELPPSVHTCVYFMRCGEFVKIGIAVCAESRQRDIQTNNPYEVVLLGTIPTDDAFKLERQFHARFWGLHHRREWFRYEGELREFVESLRDESAV